VREGVVEHPLIAIANPAVIQARVMRRETTARSPRGKTAAGPRMLNVKLLNHTVRIVLINISDTSAMFHVGSRTCASASRRWAGLTTADYSRMVAAL